MILRFFAVEKYREYNVIVSTVHPFLPVQTFTQTQLLNVFI